MPCLRVHIPQGPEVAQADEEAAKGVADEFAEEHGPEAGDGPGLLVQHLQTEQLLARRQPFWQQREEPNEIDQGKEDHQPEADPGGPCFTAGRAADEEADQHGGAPHRKANERVDGTGEPSPEKVGLATPAWRGDEGAAPLTEERIRRDFLVAVSADHVTFPGLGACPYRLLSEQFPARTGFLRAAAGVPSPRIR